MNLEDQLRSLPKKSPSKGFIKASKRRLVHQIELQQHESWFKSFLAKLGIVMPSEAFVSQARMRILSKIQVAKQPVWAWLAFTKRLAASTLIMAFAVTTTLFFVEGNQIVSASEDTYIEVLEGAITIKHADKLLWDEIDSRVELSAGDLIKIGEDSEAVIHFFDDSELRLAEQTVLLISQLSISPAYARQGIIEVSLHEGMVWGQTLNVEDGYAKFALVTRDAVVNALNSTFNIQTSLQKPTIVQIFRNKAEISTLKQETREVIDTFKVYANNQIKITAASTPIVNASRILEQDLANQWAQSNLQKDHNHLALLQANGLNRLKMDTGTLPGDMLYPIKQAKERLKLAFSFGGSNETNVQIEIANKRLNEAIVLLEQGDRQKALESLMAYQSIAREVTNESSEEIARLLLTPHQKTLVASLPGSTSIGMVKEALNQAEEMLVSDPVEKERVKLENSVDRLRDLALYIESGDVNSAKEALVNYELENTFTLENVSNLENEDDKKTLYSTILDLRNEELELIKALSEIGLNGSDEQLIIMIANAEVRAEEGVKSAIAFIDPIMPELTRRDTAKELIEEKTKIEIIVEKVQIYRTWQGQKNQINRLLANEGAKANNIAFLVEFRNALDSTRAKDYVNTKILALQSIAKINRHKAIQRKIDQSQNLRDD